MVYQTQGLILKKTDFGEASQLFRIYTKDLGKIEVLARGTKKIKSKLNSHLQFFSLINLSIAKGKNFDQLTGAVLIKNFSQLKNDFKKIILASFGLELVEQLTKTYHPDAKIFNLLLNYLETIDKKVIVKKDGWSNIQNQFIIKLMTLLGYKPKPEIIIDSNKLNNFLKSHLDQEIKVEKLMSCLTLD